jgi:hypothetical protein
MDGVFDGLLIPEAWFSPLLVEFGWFDEVAMTLDYEPPSDITPPTISFGASGS